MAIVKVVHMIAVTNGGVAAIRFMLVIMIVVTLEKCSCS